MSFNVTVTVVSAMSNSPRRHESEVTLDAGSMAVLTNVTITVEIPDPRVPGAKAEDAEEAGVGVVFAAPWATLLAKAKALGA